jgi:RNA recognition motif-containing protein
LTFAILDFEAEESAIAAVFEENEPNVIKACHLRTAFHIPNCVEYLRENRNANITVHQTKVSPNVNNSMLKTWLRKNGTGTIISACIKVNPITGLKLAYIMSYVETDADLMEARIEEKKNDFEGTLGIEGTKLARAAENVLVTGVPEDYTEAKFSEKFGSFGPIFNAKYDAGRNGGFIQFLEHGSAAKAIEAVHGQAEGSTVWKVIIFKPREDVVHEFKKNYKTTVENWKRKSVFVKYGSSKPPGETSTFELTEPKIIELFKECGEIESVRMIYTTNTYFDETNSKKTVKNPTGSAFINFVNPESAT